MENQNSMTMVVAFSVLFLPGILSSAIELGEIFETESEIAMINQPAAFICKEKVFKQGQVVGFKGMFLNPSTIRFQIWRLLESTQYLLVGEKEFTPTYLPAMFEIPLTPAEYISVEEGDLLGFAKLSSENSVVTQFDGSLSMGVVYSPTVDLSTLKAKDVIEFDPTPLPLKFSIMAMYMEGDIPSSSGRDEMHEATLPPRQIMKSTMPPRPHNEGTKVYYGASISSRESVLDQLSRATFLLPVGMLPSGRLVKFFAFFKRKESVLLQVWREVTGGVRFKLVGQIKFTPNTTGQVEIILDEENYIPTRLGDCLGFTQLESTSSIGYNFNSDMDSSLRPIIASEQAVPSTGNVLSFMALGVPYDFALGAMVDTDPGSLPPEPETTSRFDSNSAQLVIPTEPGELVLSQSLVSNLGSIDTGASKTYLMASLQFPQHAFVTAFSAYFVNNGLVQFQVWRRMKNGEGVFRLVGKQNYAMSSAPGLRTMRLSDSAHIPVRQGDLVGFVNPGTSGVIGYVFDPQMSGSALYTSDADIEVSPGQQVAFDVLTFPYRFSMAINYVRRDASDDEATFGINQFDELNFSPTPSPLPSELRLEDGELFIAQSMEPTASVISRKARQTYIIGSLQFPQGGRVTSFSAYVVNSGLVQFQIWRQISLTSFKLVGAENVTVMSGPRLLNVRLSRQLQVEEGDMLGFVNSDDRGIIGYKFQESTTGLPVYISPARLSVPPHQQVSFDLIRLPYKFSLAATYRPDNIPGAFFSNASGPILRGRAMSGVSGDANPDNDEPSGASALPENEPAGLPESSTGPFGPSGLDNNQPSGPSEPSTSGPTEGPPRIFSTTSGKGTGNNSDASDRNEVPDIKRTTPGYLVPKRNTDNSEEENVPAALKPLTNVYLILVLLIWLIVVTLVLIGCFAFWLYKKKRSKPFNYYSYRSSSVPSLARSQSNKDSDSLVRFYHSTGLLGGPGFPDNRFECPSRRDSMMNNGDGTYL